MSFSEKNKLCSLESEITLLGDTLNSYAVGSRYIVWYGKCVILHRRLRKLLENSEGRSNFRSKNSHRITIEDHCNRVMRFLVMECRAGMNTVRLSLVLLASIAQILAFLKELGMHRLKK